MIPPEPKPRPASPKPMLNPDSRLGRMAELTERKLRLEVELLELQVARVKKDLEVPLPIPCGATMPDTGGHDLICTLRVGHAEDYHLCECGVGWS